MHGTDRTNKAHFLHHVNPNPHPESVTSTALKATCRGPADLAHAALVLVPAPLVPCLCTSAVRYRGHEAPGALSPWEHRLGYEGCGLCPQGSSAAGHGGKNVVDSGIHVALPCWLGQAWHVRPGGQRPSGGAPPRGASRSSKFTSEARTICRARFPRPSRSWRSLARSRRWRD